MQPQIAFCSRCRGMRVGWNQRYVLHSLRCRQWRRHSSRLFGLMFLTAVVFLAFPQPSKTVDSVDEATALPEQEAIVQNKVVQVSGPVVRSIEAFLTAHKIPGADLKRLAQAIVAGAKKHDLDPRLIASVVIVESRGNPFAISGKDAIGVMQIHLPTWGQTADQEGINLLKVEDNVDLGARILKNYIINFGLWEGVKRYNGFFVDDPVSEGSAQEYVAKVQCIYEFRSEDRSVNPVSMPAGDGFSRFSAGNRGISL